jgi:hypothetical protein
MLNPRRCFGQLHLSYLPLTNSLQCFNGLSPATRHIATRRHVQDYVQRGFKEPSLNASDNDDDDDMQH